MKKYPVFYQGEEYKVRWKHESFTDYLIIYKVHKICGIKFFKRIYRRAEGDIDYEITLDRTKNQKLIKDTPEYRIEQVKCLFKNMEKDLYKTKKEQELKTQQKQALKEWDGVIDDVN